VRYETPEVLSRVPTAIFRRNARVARRAGHRVRLCRDATRLRTKSDARGGDFEGRAGRRAERSGTPPEVSGALGSQHGCVQMRARA
jgi:hypothetical protein